MVRGLHTGIDVAIGPPGGGLTIILTGHQVSESATVNTVIGAVSVIGVGGYTGITITADPDAKFNLSAATFPANLRTNAALNYETKTTHSVTLQATGAGKPTLTRTLTIRVVNVFETTLAALTGTFSLAENAAEGAAAGALGGKTSGSTLSLLDDAGGRVALSGSNVVRGATPLDYETATSHAFTVRETHPDAAIRDTVLSLAVTNVSVTLGALVLSSSAWVIGTPASGTINGWTAGSTIDASGVPAGLSLNTTAHTWAWDGTGTVSSPVITLTETIAEGTNSPRASTINGTITEPAAQTIYLIASHGDSRVDGVYSEAACVTAPAYPPGRVYQYITASEATAYTMTAGINTDTMPFTNPGRSNPGNVRIPLGYAIQRLVTSGDPYYLGDEAIVLYSGGGYGSHAVAKAGHTLGPLPDTTTSYNVAKHPAAVTAAQAMWPGAPIVKTLVIVDATNDDTAVPETLRGYQLQVYADFRSALSAPAMPITVVGMCPEFASGYATIERANKVAALQGTGTVWCQLPTGVGGQHEGEGSGDMSARMAAAGDVYAEAMAVALGKIAPPAFAPAFDTTPTIETGSTNDIVALTANHKAIWTVHTGYTSGFTVSDAMSGDTQVLRFVGAAPAPASVPVQVDYRDAYGQTGTVSLTVEVIAVVPVTYIAYDNFNRANAGPSNTALGNTSGDGSTGAGLTWAVRASTGAAPIAKIESNKARLITDGSSQYPRAGVDVGAGDVRVKATITVAGPQPSLLLAGAGMIADSYAITLSSSGSATWEGSFGSRPFGTFTALADGTYDFQIDFFRSTDEAEFFINGAVVVSRRKTTFADDLAGLGTYAGFGVVHINDNPLFDTFSASVLLALAGLQPGGFGLRTGVASSGTITGATAGSTLGLSGAPSGFTINSAARTWAWDGTGTVSTGSLTITETLAGYSNSPKANAMPYEVVAAAVVTLVHTTADNTSVAAVSKAVTAGKYYVLGSWTDGALTVDGTTSGVTGLALKGDNWKMFGYAPATSGTKSFLVGGGGRPQFILEITGVSGFNGSVAEITTGATVASGPITDVGVCFVTDVDGVPAGSNMTYKGSEPANLFHAYAFTTSRTPTMTWTGTAYNRLAAAGLT